MHPDPATLIPHRPPFLLVDEILEIHDQAIRAAYTFRPDDELWSRIYAGHYPEKPITPGVLLCELVFQTGAALLSHTVREEEIPGVPMVTRIQSVKFKRPIFPGDRVEMAVALKERVANAFFLRGAVLKEGERAVEVDFAVTVAEGA